MCSLSELQPLQPWAHTARRVLCGRRRSGCRASSTCGVLCAHHHLVGTEARAALHTHDWPPTRAPKAGAPDTLLTLQTRVAGLKYGKWGRENFGAKPTKVDAIQWYTMRLEELRRQMALEMEPEHRDLTSTAFVTFKCGLSRSASAQLK